MNESVIGILPKDNLLILNTDTIERKIRDNYRNAKRIFETTFPGEKIARTDQVMIE